MKGRGMTAVREKNEYVTDDASYLISKTILQYINENIEKKKYTLEDMTKIFEYANVMNLYFVDDYDYKEGDPFRGDEYTVNSTIFYKIVEKLSKHRENFALEEYTKFLQSIGHPEQVIQSPFDIKGGRDGHKYINSYVSLIEQVIEQGEEKFVNFVKLITEIYRKYPYRNLPKYDEWKDLVMDKNNKFELPASLLLPMIVESYSEKVTYPQSDFQILDDLDLSF